MLNFQTGCTPCRENPIDFLHVSVLIPQWDHGGRDNLTLTQL